MRTITISEKDFDSIFDRAEEEFEFDHQFMKREERLSDFKGTLRYHHLMRYRNSIKNLKQRLIKE
jgi:hypothetical protein